MQSTQLRPLAVIAVSVCLLGCGANKAVQSAKPSPPPQLDAQLKNLDAPTPEDQAAAIRWFVAKGETYIPELATAAADSSTFRGQNAVRALAAIGSVRAFSSLDELYARGDTQGKEAVLYGLDGARSGRALNIVRLGLRSAVPGVQQAALSSLITWKVPSEDWPRVFQLAQSGEWVGIRSQALTIVGGSRPKGCEPVLRAGLRDADPGCRRTSLWGLAQMHVRDLGSILKSAASDPNQDVRDYAKLLGSKGASHSRA